MLGGFVHVQSIIKGALSNVPKIMDSEPVTVEIEKFDESNVLLAVRPYATPEDYWDVCFQSYKEIKKALGAANIAIPYLQRGKL